MAFDVGTVKTIPFVIPALGTVSGAQTLRGFYPVGIFVPTSFEGTVLKFQTSVDGSAYVTVKGEDGVDLSVTVAAAKFCQFDPSRLFGVNFLKIVSGTAVVPARTLTLIARPY